MLMSSNDGYRQFQSINNANKITTILLWPFLILRLFTEIILPKPSLSNNSPNSLTSAGFLGFVKYDYI